MQDQQTVAVIGAGGAIGFGLAQNLARAGFDVRAWNRTRSKIEPLAGEGATIVDTPAEAVAGADAVLSVLLDIAVTQDALDGAGGALAAAAPGAVWLQMGTLGADGTATCIALAERHGLRFVDAPVVGTKQPALDGKLTILAATDDDTARAEVDPILDAVGQRTMWVGAAGEATKLKLVVNSWLVSVVEGIAESFALAEGLGLDPRLLLEAVGGGPLDPGYLKLKGQAILDRSFEPSFALAGGAKDARLIIDIAEANGLDLPVLRAIRDRWNEGAELHGDRDIIATYLTSAPGSVPAE